MSLFKSTFSAIMLSLLAVSTGGTASLAGDVTVMTSGGYTAALPLIAADFEKQTGYHLNVIVGPSMGTDPTAIPARLARGEKADAVFMVGYALGDLIKNGAVKADSRIDMANSSIGMVVRAGEPKPDIHDLASFKAALLAAKSIAYSDSASGVYISREMFKILGLEAELAPKSHRIVAVPVASVVAKGEAEIGFQQVSELLAIKGVDFVGKIPDGAQKVTLYSAGVPVNAEHPEGAKALFDYLATDKAIAMVAATGLDPIKH